MADCIDALITANIKTAIESITPGNGYNTDTGIVEEKRSILKVNAGEDTFTLIELLSPDIDDDFQHTEDGTLRYMIYHFNGEDDETGNPIQYQNRNYFADVQKALMVDRTRGGYAQNTNIKSWGHDFYYQQGTIDVPLICSWVLVEVQRLIDADNPYQLA